MIETVTLLAYLLGHPVKSAEPLRLQATLPKQGVTQSPALAWQKIPPAADSLVIIVKDKKQYCWVVYNVPATATHFAMGENRKINLHNEGVNSWGQHAYHACVPTQIELFALDQRLSIQSPTGEQLEKMAEKHALAMTTIKIS